MLAWTLSIKNRKLTALAKRPTGETRQGLLGWFVCAGCFVLLSASQILATDQVPLPRSEVRHSSAEFVAEILHQAVDLEDNQRWGEALSLYEDAIRRQPESPQLKQRLQVARFHYDVRRRYADTSFLQSLAEMTDRQAIDLYREVLHKIDANYVESPDWSLILQRGAEDLVIALHETPFRTHRVGVSDAQIDQFSVKLARSVPSLKAANRQSAAEEAERVALWAAQEIHVPVSHTILEFMCGASASLDTYSTFLTSSQLDEVYQQIEGNFVGLGVELKPRDHDLLIVDVIAGGPAALRGFRPGDRIVGVDQSYTQNVPPNQVADLLRGPEGSTVEVHLIHADGQPQSITVQRKRVEVPSVDQIQIVDTSHGIGYLRINSFQKTTSRDIDSALWKLHRQGMRGLIIDVRKNPGGLLEESVEVADRFVDKGTIVSTRGRSSRENRQYTANRTGTWQVPLVVLIDGESASASEIFAAAMRDHGRAIVVGAQSYGKGSVQGIFPLAGASSGLRLTTAKFYAPSGQRISGEGVRPDVLLPTEHMKPAVSDAGNPTSTAQIDVGMWTAIEVARKQVEKVEIAQKHAVTRAS